MKTNEQVLSAVGERRKIIETIVNRKKNWIGHILRGDGLLNDVIEGRMEKKRTQGRRRIGMINGGPVQADAEKSGRQSWLAKLNTMNLPDGRAIMIMMTGKPSILAGCHPSRE